MKTLTDSTIDVSSKLIPQQKTVSIDNAQDGIDTCVHNNYLEYIEYAWANHLGIVIDPKYFWHMILSEVALIVKANPKQYQSLFTSSDDIIDISVPTSDPTILPIDLIIEQLVKLVPIDTDIFLPSFSTETPDYSLAIQTTFADVVSPYYNYSMFMCGIPSYTINGSQKDWETLSNNFDILCNKLNISNKFERLSAILKEFIDEPFRDDIETWKSIFRLEQCGSGSQVEVFGWITSFYTKLPSPRYSYNFSSHISSVNYTNITTNKKYVMYNGLFESIIDNGILYPKYTYIIKEVN